MTIKNITATIILILASIAALYYGKSLLYPVILSILFYFVIRSMARTLDQVKIFRKIPKWIKTSLAGLIFILMINMLVNILLQNTQSLMISFEEHQNNIEKLLSKLSRLLGMNVSQKIESWFTQLDLKTFTTSVVKSASNMFSTTFLMIFYILFFIIEEKHFKKKLMIIYNDEKKYENTKNILLNIEHSSTRYLGLKSLVSLVSALASYTVLLIFGVDERLLWTFLIFIFNFIPIIGAFVSLALPTLFFALQIGELSTPILMLSVLFTVQTIIENLLEPKLMGNSLNISPSITLFALAFWGALWGIMGMIISIPVTVVLIILLANFEQTKFIAILLSNDGKV